LASEKSLSQENLQQFLPFGRIIDLREFLRQIQVMQFLIRSESSYHDFKAAINRSSLGQFSNFPRRKGSRVLSMLENIAGVLGQPFRGSILLPTPHDA
jgi:hypothetical protein